MAERPKVKQASIGTFFGSGTTTKWKSESNNKESDPKRKKYDRDGNRTIKAAWFKEFEWLEHSSDAQLLFCKLCRETRKKNVFALGKDSSKPKKDDLTKHGRSDDHKNSVEEKTLKSDLATAATNAYVGCKAAITAQMATLLMQAKEGIPMRKNSPLLELQLFNVSLILVWHCENNLSLFLPVPLFSSRVFCESVTWAIIAGISYFAQARGCSKISADDMLFIAHCS